jgi:3-oxoacyl-[acyl-carrier protein] reductase
MDLGLAGRRAVVTGGSKGIGLASARELHAEGASVAICARDAAELEAAAATIGTDRVFSQVADVCHPAQVAGFIDAAAVAMGGVDILVNNAGGARPGNFEALTDDDWRDDRDVKLFAQIRCVRAALAQLRRRDGARVININSVYAKYPDPSFFATTVNRAACLSLNKALSAEFGMERTLINAETHGIRVGRGRLPTWAARCSPVRMEPGRGR